MQIRIDKQSEVPARDQLRQQIIFLISTGQLLAGTALPSVRELGRRLKIHHNTISRVYSQLAGEGWLLKKRGSRMVVGEAQTRSPIEDFADLDGLIDGAIRLARTRGYSLQQLTGRVRERLLAEPSDHLLLVAPEREFAELIGAEIAEHTGREPDICSASMLQHDPSLAIGAALITPSYHLHKVEPFVSPDRPVVDISFSPADEHIAAIRKLPQSSVVGVVSVSALFLETANGLLAPAIGRRHSFREFLMRSTGSAGGFKLEDYVREEWGPALVDWAASEGPSKTSGLRSEDGRRPTGRAVPELQAIDLLFCDSIAYRLVKHRRGVKYRLIADESIDEIANIANATLPS